MEEGASRARRRVCRGSAAARGGGVGVEENGAAASVAASVEDGAAKSSATAGAVWRGAAIGQPDDVSVVVSIVLSKWRDGNDGLEGGGLYTQRIGPSWWHQPAQKVGIGTG